MKNPIWILMSILMLLWNLVLITQSVFKEGKIYVSNIVGIISSAIALIGYLYINKEEKHKDYPDILDHDIK